MRQQGRRRLIFDASMCSQLAEEIAERDLISDSRQRVLRSCVEKLSAVDRDPLRRRYEEGATI